MGKSHKCMMAFGHKKLGADPYIDSTFYREMLMSHLAIFLIDLFDSVNFIVIRNLFVMSSVSFSNSALVSAFLCACKFL